MGGIGVIASLGAAVLTPESVWIALPGEAITHEQIPHRAVYRGRRPACRSSGRPGPRPRGSAPAGHLSAADRAEHHAARLHRRRPAMRPERHPVRAAHRRRRARQHRPHGHRRRRRLPDRGAARTGTASSSSTPTATAATAPPSTSTARRLRAHYIARGFAWAASSYQTNGYDVGQGVRDSHALIARFARSPAARPRRLHDRRVDGRARHRGRDRGATAARSPARMPVLRRPRRHRAVRLLPRRQRHRRRAHRQPDRRSRPGPRRSTSRVPAERGTRPAARCSASTWAPPPDAHPAGPHAGATAVERRSGGDRPGFDSAFAYWNARPASRRCTDVPFLFGVYPGLSGGTAGIADGNVTDNRLTLYQLDDQPWLTGRRAASSTATCCGSPPPHRPSRGPDRRARASTGDPRVPVLSLHTIGDLFVPLSMEQIYATRGARNRQSQAVRRPARSGPSGTASSPRPELRAGFDDLVTWVRTGQRPAGDAILDRRARGRGPTSAAGSPSGCARRSSRRPAQPPKALISLPGPGAAGTTLRSERPCRCPSGRPIARLPGGARTSPGNSTTRG